MPTTKELKDQATKIKGWLSACDLSKAEHREALGRMLLCVYLRQTSDEKASGTTKHLNGVGFAHCHAEIGTSLAQQYSNRKRLTTKQWAFVVRMMKKYTMQLSQDYFLRNQP